MRYQSFKRETDEEINARLLQRLQERKQTDTPSQAPSPQDKPAYNTPAYWIAHRNGHLSWEEVEQDHALYEARRKRAKDSAGQKTRAPHRHLRPAPTPSKQWVKPMATTAARDDRLTPQAKALLQVIAARTGKGRETNTTKTTLADIMRRCSRSIQRYIAELVKFGYIRTQIRKSPRSGLYTGLRIWIMNDVLPYFSGTNDLFEVAAVQGRGVREQQTPGFSEETEASLIKIHTKIFNLAGLKKPPWISDFVFG